MIAMLTDSPPRWIVRTLMGISALFAIAILSVRTPGIIATARLSAQAERARAAAAFGLPAPVPAAPFTIDSIGRSGQATVPYRRGSTVMLAQGADLIVSGWALERPTGGPLGAIYARLDGSTATSSIGITSIERPDVAQALANPRARDSGFTIDVPTGALPAGRHTIELRGVDAAHRIAYTLGAALVVVIADRTLSGKTHDAIDAVNGVLLGPEGPEQRSVRIQRSFGAVTVSGWGFLSDGPRLANGASLVVDNARPVSGRYNLLRADVATVYHDVRLAKSGFELTVPLRFLAPGRHVLSVQFAAGNNRYLESRSSIAVIVE